MSRLRRLPRLAMALAVGFILITVTNSAPWYFGGLQSLIMTNQDIFVGLSLVTVTALALWRGGHLDEVQSKGKLPLLELIEVGALLVALTAFFGLGVSPLSMCLGGGEGFTCYASLQGFLRGILGLTFIVAGEEMFFVV
ncbi:MAG: hypothetical protein JRN06_05830 [Nitrososphaerota archaeon]|nr:hypothetical protein [Nitrososphaerota archaeon]MDG7024135.1 hypothetical protein [Nitrososphaerota archaeon]